MVGRERELNMVSIGRPRWSNSFMEAYGPDIESLKVHHRIYYKLSENFLGRQKRWRRPNIKVEKRCFIVKYPSIWISLSLDLIIFRSGWCGGGLGRVTRVWTTPALTSLGSCLFAHQLVDINGKQSTRPYYNYMDVYSDVCKVFSVVLQEKGKDSI